MDDETRAPSIPELFLASMAAAGIVFAAILFLFALLALFGSDPSSAFLILIYGGLYGMIITFGLTVILIAPLGTALGLALQHFAPPGRWHGAAIGALIATILGGFLIFQSGPEIIRDGGNFVVLAVFAAISAIAGWTVQRTMLRWPLEA